MGAPALPAQVRQAADSPCALRLLCCAGHPLGDHYVGVGHHWVPRGGGAQGVGRTYSHYLYRQAAAPPFEVLQVRARARGRRVARPWGTGRRAGAAAGGWRGVHCRLRRVRVLLLLLLQVSGELSLRTSPRYKAVTFASGLAWDAAGSRLLISYGSGGSEAGPRGPGWVYTPVWQGACRQPTTAAPPGSQCADVCCAAWLRR
jgi:hypothetical protein